MPKKQLKNIVVRNKLQPVTIIMFEYEYDQFYRDQYEDYDIYRNEYDNIYCTHFKNYWDYYEVYHNQEYFYHYHTQRANPDWDCC